MCAPTAHKPSVSVPCADLQDGSILFRFGDEPSTSASEDSETLPEQTQQAQHSAALTSATPEPRQQQAAADAVLQVGTTNNAQEQANKEKEQPVISASEDSADEETSDSDTASEALANMTPDKLENMKASGSVLCMKYNMLS